MILHYSKPTLSASHARPKREGQEYDREGKTRRKSYSLPYGVHNGDQIARQTHRYASIRRVGHDEVDRDEHAPPEEEDAQAEEGKGRVSEGAQVGHVAERFLARGQARPNGEVAEDAQRQDQKRADPDGPAEADLRDQLRHHGREDDAAEGRGAHDQAQGCTAFSTKPCRYLKRGPFLTVSRGSSALTLCNSRTDGRHARWRWVLVWATWTYT
jgi:hypothetical protein